MKSLIIFRETHVLQNLNNKNYYNELLNIIGTPNLKAHNCHIDFSLFLYKVLLTSENMEVAIRKISLFFKDLSKHNNIYVYLDPQTNLRKQKLQARRSETKQKTIERVREHVSKILEKDEFNDDIKILMVKDNFTNYVDNLSFFNKNIITKDKNLKHIHIDDEAPIDFDKITDQHLIKKQFDIKEIKKQTFSVFLNSYNFKNHQNYILNILKEKKILTDEHLIVSEIYDAELNIIYNIVSKNFKNNIIFSADQDVILFSLMHFKSNYIYIKTDINIESCSLSILFNNYLNKNISYLVIFFNKSDYFNGIERFRITADKLKNLYKKHPYLKQIFSQEHFLDRTELIASLLQFYKKCPDNSIVADNELLCEKIEKYIEHLNSYLNMEPDFYSTTGDELESISILDMFKFLDIKNPLTVVYRNNSIKKVLWREL